MENLNPTTNDLATLPRADTFLLYASLARRIRCLGAMLSRKFVESSWCEHTANRNGALGSQTHENTQLVAQICMRARSGNPCNAHDLTD